MSVVSYESSFPVIAANRLSRIASKEKNGIARRKNYRSSRIK
jgi:hypothetical protein